MKFLRRAMLLALFASAGTLARGADAFSETPVFTFTAVAGPAEVKDPDTELAAASGTLTLRPNAAAEYFLYAYNPDAEKKAYVVEVAGGPGSGLAGTAKVTIPAKRWVRVKVPKPAPPAAKPDVAPAPAAAAPAPGGAPAAPPEKLPPGAELAAGGSFGFTLRLLNDDGTAAKDADDKPYGRRVEVIVQKPDDYVDPPTGTFTLNNKLSTVELTIAGKAGFTGTANLLLAFPPQDALKDATVRAGIYKRTLTAAPAPAAPPKATLTGSVENAGESLRIHLGVDGFDRAFIYRPAVAGDTAKASIIRVQKTAVRVVRPGPAFAAAVATQPVAAFPLKIEADNDPAGTTAELWLRRVGDGDAAAKNEVFKLGGARDERVWVDVAGPLDAGFLVSDTSKDWVAPIDLRNFRGRCEVVAVLRNKQFADDKANYPTGVVQSAAFPLTIDGTPPEQIEFRQVPEKHIKGKPLPVIVTANDTDTRVEQVVFVIGKPQLDGKPAADAVIVPAVAVTDKAGTRTGEFTALLELPKDKAGDLYITAQMTDSVGLVASKTQVVQLVDAPPPTGTISGVVVIGERRQPGITVRLLNGKGEEKATAATNEYGRFKFEKVPVGDYVVFAEKEDSSYGSEGKVAVAVKADEPPVKADPNAKPAPPPSKPLPIKPTIVLVKRTK